MDVGDFYKVIKEFNSFRQKLINNIEGNIDNNRLFKGEDCYIINDIWYNKLENCFNQ